MENGSKMDMEIFALLNSIRLDPKSFIPTLSKVIDQFEGDVIKREGKVNLRTNEGVKAVREAVEFLKNAKPCLALRWDASLGKACKEHAEDTGPKGLLSHEGSNGSSVKERIEKYGKIQNCYGENLSFHCDEAHEVL
jgi:uncharacterized protein YkwD